MTKQSIGTILRGAQAWAEWIATEEFKTGEAYGNQPDFLIADWNREREITRDYEGREILELLQNANDQAAEIGEQGNAAILLLEAGLVVANSGLPFSLEGVKSLQTCNLSPKRYRRGQLIGNKGLGFRAVLNWSTTPTVVSGDLRLAVSHEYTRQKQRELSSRYPDIAVAVAKEQDGSDALVVPLLRFPLSADSRNVAWLPATSQQILEVSEELISGHCYSTVIGMPFDIPRARDEARVQIERLRPEVLLFAQNLKELRIGDGKGRDRVWTRVGDDSFARIADGEETLGAWQIHRLTKSIPEDVRALDKDGASSFEVTVAIPEGKSRGNAPLFMYFPTEITLPLPVICHATLELEQNRKHLQQKRDGNRYVLGQLARFLVQIAEQIANAGGADAWEGASLLVPTADFPTELDAEGFPAALLEEAKERRILPTLGGTPMKAADVCTIYGSDGSWLPVRFFRDFVPIRNEMQNRFVRLIGVRAITGEEVKGRIDSATLSVNERIALITELILRPDMAVACTSALLLDQAGLPVGPDMRIFMAPVTEEGIGFPQWANLRFLNEAMRESLAQTTGSRDRSELQRKLAAFGVVDYSLANVVSALVAEVNRAQRANPDGGEKYRSELLVTLFSMYTRDVGADKSPVKVDRATIQLLSQAGELASVGSLYLGQGINKTGEIMQALFGPWGPEYLLDIDALPVLTDDFDQLRNFLLWLGVSEWPRESEHMRPDPAYLDFVLRSIRYPVTMGDQIINSVGEATFPQLRHVRTVVLLEQILQNAEPTAIAAWLAMDPRGGHWANSASNHVQLDVRPGRALNARTYRGPLPSYIRWVLARTQWLRRSATERLSPKDCVLGEHASEGLFPRPAEPSPELLDLFGISRPQIVEGWRRAGVLTSLAYLDRDEIYAKLLELPDRSPDGKLARPLYHWLLDANPGAPTGLGTNELEFRRRGKMWGSRSGVEAYYPVSEMYHADSEGLPKALLDKLAVVSLRRRAGNDKVEQLFGVRPIEQTQVRKELISYEPALRSEPANANFQAAKPYLHKLRSSRTGQLQQLAELKRLQLVVCRSLKIALEFDGERYEYSVPPWEWLLQDDVLRVQADPSNALGVSEILLANSIGEALAALFRLTDGGEFAQMYSCPEQDRLYLLRRLRSESSLDDMDSIKAAYEAQETRAAAIASFPLSDPPTPTAPTVPRSDAGQPGHEPTENPTQLPAPAGAAAPLIVVERSHIAVDMPKTRNLQIKRRESSDRKAFATYRLADGNFSERKVMEFEEALGRFPMLVGHTMGTDGPLCDILSFASQETLDNFRKTADMHLVDRFIEVKGRNNVGAAIELKRNSLTGALNYRSRYFLYRLYEADPHTFELAVLQDPLGCSNALEQMIVVHMMVAESTQQFTLSDGIERARQHACSDASDREFTNDESATDAIGYK